jgi:hypothetical protein
MAALDRGELDGVWRRARTALGTLPGHRGSSARPRISRDATLIDQPVQFCRLFPLAEVSSVIANASYVRRVLPMPY